MEAVQLDPPLPYEPPALVRLGTLAELTQGGAGTIDDTFNGGWQGSFLPP